MTRPVARPVARLAVEAVGPQAIVQDRGRPGLARWGITPSGPFDVGAHEAAALAVGNAPDAAGIEVLLGGLRLRAHGTVLVCVTGAVGVVRVDGLAVAAGRVFAVPSGALLELGVPERGLRGYLAVAGGFDVPPVLGSRSRDTLAGIGPAPLSVGDVLPVGRAAGNRARGRARGRVSSAEGGSRYPTQDGLPDGGARLQLLPPPRAVAPAVLAALTDTVWSVGADSDRVAVRLAGPAIDHPRPEVPSEALVAGAVQLPPSGRPLVFGPDHPLTGGYPVVGVVPSTGLDALAQLRPGETVRFVGDVGGPN